MLGGPQGLGEKPRSQVIIADRPRISKGKTLPNEWHYTMPFNFHYHQLHLSSSSRISDLISNHGFCTTRIENQVPVADRGIQGNQILKLTRPKAFNMF